MRFAVIHCRNSQCRQHIWVPEQKLGCVGRCPECGHVLQTPTFVPADELVEGPHIIQDIHETNRPVGSVPS